MKVHRYRRYSGERSTEDMFPSTILDLEIKNEGSYYEDKVERLTESLRIMQQVLGMLLDELPQDVVRRAFRGAFAGVHVYDPDTDDSSE